MKRSLSLVTLSVLVTFLTATTGWAQATAQMSGTVSDDTGGVLPGVTVTVTQTDQGVTRVAVTDGTGTYVLTNLPTGPYELEVALQGFQTYIQTGIVLQVGDSASIDAELGISALQETITVEAAAPLVDVQSAGIGEVVSQETIVSLPLQGRNVTDLLVLAGAAVQTGQAGARQMAGGVNIVVAGGLSTGVAYTLDGVNHNNPLDNRNLPLPFPDALQEFRVATGGLEAGQGMHTGASVNAVTKSGTNRFSGNAFEFLRDAKFNSPEHFAPMKDGKQADDGLNRNQFGGTLGGPIVSDRAFFFGAIQRTVTDRTPTASEAFVPTADMLAGDFTTFASAQCNTRPIKLRAPFVNNMVDPADLSPAGMAIAARLPSTNDPCGLIRYQRQQNDREYQAVGKVDLNMNANNTLFARYIITSFKRDGAFQNSPDNVLTADIPGRDQRSQTTSVGHTLVMGNSAVNGLRAAFNTNTVIRTSTDYFENSDVGINAHNYAPTKEMALSVDGGFELGGGGSATYQGFTDAFEVANDYTTILGSHQVSIGGSVSSWSSDQESHARSPGQFDIEGDETGAGLADLLTGKVTALEHGGPSGSNMTQKYLGAYVADVWRASDRVTVNLGLRWEPFFGQHMSDGEVTVWSRSNFDAGIKSTVFKNAPAGLIYPGDTGFPAGKSGMEKQWLNLSPRAGVAWDASGDGRTAVRASYSLGYDFASAEVHFINATSPPFGNRLKVNDPPGGLDNPYAHFPGGDPHPIITGPDIVYPLAGAIGTIDPNINSPRVQTWNLTVEQQVGDSLQVAASYLGRYSDRLWGTVEENPGTWTGGKPSSRTLNKRRELYLLNPAEAKYMSNVNVYKSIGDSTYRGLKLSVRRRATTGVSFSGNYTWGYCYGNRDAAGFLQLNDTYKFPNDTDYDKGNCAGNRTHVGNVTMGYMTPEVDNAAMRAVFSNWRMAGVLQARSGSWFTVDLGTRGDNRGTGIRSQRVNQISDDVYGPGADRANFKGEPQERINNYWNRDAFEAPKYGTYGDHELNSLEGPMFWNVNLALSKLVSFRATQQVELRFETFNLFNTFNWGNPQDQYTSRFFGRISSQAGSPRILQFGIKYAF
jgi:hypothetical protein